VDGDPGYVIFPVLDFASVQSRTATIPVPP
jgi:hypothetical protein